MIGHRTVRILATCIWTLSAAATGVQAQQSTPPLSAEEEAIREIVLRTIRENPEVLVETLLAYQEEAQAQAEAEQRAAIAGAAELLRSDANAGVLGNPDGGVVLIEFFDYNCPYCRQAAPILFELIEANPELAIVMREWPILGPESELAARASLAALHAFGQEGFAAFHEALMAQPRANAATIGRAAEAAGLDHERLQAAMDAPDIDTHLTASRRLAEQLGITGTPTFLLGDTLVPGLLGKDDLQALIAAAGDAE